MNAEQVRQRILRTFNFIDREFLQGFYFIIPADDAKQSACRNGAVAYVWRAYADHPNSDPTGYEETLYPRCRSSDNPRTNNCALDDNGKYYVYLCNSYNSQPDYSQVSVLIHEAAHHAGPNDVTYSREQMRRESQFNQLMNAANYQWFAQSVTDGACADKDPNCQAYTSYCRRDANIRAKCKQTCGVCTPCADTYDYCAWYRDNNYCGTANVLAQCKRTCGACR